MICLHIGPLFRFIWYPVGFHNLDFYFLPEAWKVFCHYFLNMFSVSLSLSSLSESPVMQKLLHLMVSHKFLKLSSPFFTLFFFFHLRLYDFWWSVFKFTDPVFYLRYSVVELLYWNFQFSYPILQLYNFHLILFNSLYLFVKILKLFLYCSLDLGDYFCDHYFELPVE